MKSEQIEKLQQLIDRSKKTVFFGGAGVSTESGLPDFRSQDGLYHQQYAYPPEEILSHDFLMEQPEEFFRFYQQKLVRPEVFPNAAHKKLAELEQAGRLTGIITQNIDGLHQMAGSRHVVELHGSIHRNHCMQCGAANYDRAFVRDAGGIPRCPKCGGIVRPDVVLYGEGLAQNDLDEAVRLLSEADLLLIGGTSLAVYPAAGLVRYFGGQNIVLINRDATPMDRAATLVIRDKIGETLAQIAVR